MKELLHIFSVVGSQSGINFSLFSSNLSKMVDVHKNNPGGTKFMNDMLIETLIQKLRMFQVNEEYKDLLKQYVTNSQHRIF